MDLHRVFRLSALRAQGVVQWFSVGGPVARQPGFRILRLPLRPFGLVVPGGLTRCSCVVELRFLCSPFACECHATQVATDRQPG